MDRILAFAWDYLLIAAYIAVLVLAGLAAMKWAPQQMSWAFGCPARGQLFGFLLLTLPVVLYFSISEASRQQASWGKSRRGLRVVSTGDGRLGLLRSLLRNLLKFTPWELSHFFVWQAAFRGPDLPSWINLGFGAVWALIAAYGLSLWMSGSGQAIYDRLARARVVLR